ncbi:MAG: hypothetical protein EZS28_039983 [Streblomastix strix]|uniref:Uncharacterized protein n=1 Tax=Streblomastix strix TaxID=222440 RepID=A0A5J4U3A7_9EUKA|nr:MAG: hypothetical protein EZS28_039983 [Streblomastix strix]
MGREQKGRDQTRRSWMQKRKRIKAIVITVTANKSKKIGLGKEKLQLHEPYETRTGPWMKNAIELKNPISLIYADSNAQTNLNIDYNYISLQHNIPHMFISSLSQQHLPSPALEETLAILRKISPGYPRELKEKEPERKQPKLQQYAGLMDIYEKFHEIMKSIIEEEKKKLNIILQELYQEYPNKDDPAFFYPPKNYRPTPIPRPEDLFLSEEQLNQFDGDVSEGVVPFCL